MSAKQIVLNVSKDANSPLGVKLKTSKSLPTKCRVVEVFPGSPADQYGVKTGDLLIRINDQEIRFLTKEGVGEVLKYCSESVQATIAIIREDGGKMAMNKVEPTNEEGKKSKVRFQSSEQSDPKATATTTAPEVPAQRTPVPAVINYITDVRLTDRLIAKAPKVLNSGCNERACIGSKMFPKRRDLKKPYTKEEMKDLATDFLKQYYTSIKSVDTAEHRNRLENVLSDIESQGTYELTFKELSFGCRTAWRNAPRCINRIQWRKLEVFDNRDVRTAEEMFAAMLRHVRFCSNPTNPGVLRSAITVFPVAVDESHEYRVWNSQFIKYAGYAMEDGTILGDPADVEFTDVCIELGWKPPEKRTAFDVLPIVLQANGGQPQVFELESKDVLEVPLTHPKYPEFDRLEMKWYAIPGVSSLLLEIGGLRFTAAPFSGWYMVTEIGARDLADPQRYNMLEKMAQIMKLDTKSDQMWKDKALVELNAAVLHSYNKCGVTILDHHSASESFMKFMEQEYRERGGCSADWVWIVPPMSGSATPVFHQEMLLYHLTPSFEYQEDPIIKWKKSKRSALPVESARDRFKRVVRWAARLAKIMQEQMKKRRHCTILYATETGRSETYARMLLKLFGHAFNCELHCMDSYPFDKLEDEEIVLIVASTFGSGEPPSNGEEFAHKLVKLRAPQLPKTHGRISVVLNPNWGLASKKDLTHPLSSIKFAVFGLGSRAYPDTFCAFAHTMDKLFDELGGERIHPLGEGDELCGQEESFRDWAEHCYHSACEYYNLDPNLDHSKPLLEAHKWGKNKFRLRKVEQSSLKTSPVADLRNFHNRPNILKAVLKERTKLQSPISPRSTIKLVLDFKHCQDKVNFEPGDHLSVFPMNSPQVVNELLNRLDLSVIGPDDPVILEYNKSGGEGSDFEEEKRFPHAITIREALTSFLDITTPPTPQLLKLLATQATRQEDVMDIEALARGEAQYEEWKYNYYPSMSEVINWFYSLHGHVDPCLLLSQLPVLQSRYYSISSSPRTHPGEVDITVAVVAYHVKPLPDNATKQQGKRFSLHPHANKGPKHFGVCSNWLNRIEIGSDVPCFFRKAANFHMPSDPLTPIIMVGPGTGIAPFRSFWEERIYQIEKLRKYRMRTSDPISPETSSLLPPLPHNLLRSESDQGLLNAKKGGRQSLTLPPSLSELDGVDTSSDSSESPKMLKRSMSLGDSNQTAISEMLATRRDFGPMYLFFGCRQSNMDHLYKEDMRKAELLGALDEFHVALSREEDLPKTYVQDKMKENADLLVNLLLEGAHFYVCGDISMARDVSCVLHDILVKNAAMTVQEAKEFVDAMKENDMYHEDIFGVTLKTAEVTDRYRNAARRTWNVLLSKSGDDTEPLPSGAGKRISRPQKLSRMPTVTLLLDTPSTTSDTLIQLPLPSGRKISQPVLSHTPVHRKHLVKLSTDAN